MRTAHEFTFRAGALAYLDTMRSGLVPCRVVSVTRTSWGSIECVVMVTADRYAYERGRLVTASENQTVPRSHVRFRTYGARIIGGYSWSPDGEAGQ